MVNRLNPFLSHLIHPSQGAFILGKHMQDNILITHEILHSLRTSQAKKKVGMALKLDMEKAYDRVH